ncbi:MAG: ABC transporter substrate-binding protein [Deltaproteobacteria bacterium]|nr:ABC transporter substrate-binding protein [Deltaproteobacteria bacterium]
MVMVGVLSFLMISSGALAADKPFPLETCWMPSTEAFIPWYAKKKGWDKEEGLDIKMNFFDSGAAQMEAIPAKAWVLGSTGGVGQIIGALRYETPLIGIGYEDSRTEAILVRPDSPIMKVKGFNPKYPEVYGSPETVKGKTFLATLVSSSHYTMVKYLAVFGLTEKDVVVKNMDNPQALAAFESGEGEMVALWAPLQYIGMQKGWKIAGDLSTCGGPLLTTLIGVKSFCEEHPDIVAKFLRVYIRVQHFMRKQGDKLVPDLQAFYKEWAGYDLSDEFAKKELALRPQYTYQEQLDAMKGSPFNSQADKWQADLATFFAQVGKFTPADKEKVLKTPYVTDKYLKMVKLPIPE